MPEGFALVDIGQMNLQKRQSDALDRVPEGNARVRECCRIDEQESRITVGVNPVKQCSFRVGLKAPHRKALGFNEVPDALLNGLQRVCTIDSGFTGAQQVEVRAV